MPAEEEGIPKAAGGFGRVTGGEANATNYRTCIYGFKHE